MSGVVGGTITFLEYAELQRLLREDNTIIRKVDLEDGMLELELLGDWHYVESGVKYVQEGVSYSISIPLYDRVRPGVASLRASSPPRVRMEEG